MGCEESWEGWWDESMGQSWAPNDSLMSPESHAQLGQRHAEAPLAATRVNPLVGTFVASTCDDPIEFIFTDTARCCCES
jgi:hypothetical protein